MPFIELIKPSDSDLNFSLKYSNQNLSNIVWKDPNLLQYQNKALEFELISNIWLHFSNNLFDEKLYKAALKFLLLTRHKYAVFQFKLSHFFCIDQLSEFLKYQIKDIENNTNICLELVIDKGFVCYLDDLLEMLTTESHPISVVFRVGDIELWNQEEVFDVVSFFGKLATTNSWFVDQNYKKTYEDLSYMLCDISQFFRDGCIYHKNDNYTSVDNDFHYCPGSIESFSIKGNILLNREKLHYRDKVTEESCYKCYKYVGTSLEKYSRLVQKIKSVKGFSRSKFKTLSEMVFDPFKGVVNSSDNPNPRNWNAVIVTGWYGTETAGDKAILGEIINQLRSYSEHLKIYITTIDPRVSWQTKIEMKLENIEIIPIEDCASVKNIRKVDAVIMGGGPLMESSRIRHIKDLFLLANKFNKVRVIYGCGIGPIHKPTTESWIKTIVRVSDVAFYRDKESLEYALRLGGIKDSQLGCDPAVQFVHRWKQESPNKSIKKLKFTTLLREQTKEYDATNYTNVTKNNFLDSVELTLAGLAENNSSMEVHCMSMHMYWRGVDDRSLNNRLQNRMKDKINIRSQRCYIGLYSLLNHLSDSELIMAMRYHSHLFAISLGIPFLSIDYTGKNGKVSNLISRTNLTEFSENYNKFNFVSAKEKMIFLQNNRDSLSLKLLEKSEEMVQSLQDSYNYFWSNER
jgi:polysaccharide pyruvyl transferase WcaK-like protein